jgi:hypothetical protein
VKRLNRPVKSQPSLYRFLAVPARDETVGLDETIVTKAVETVDNDCSTEWLLASNLIR